MTELQPIIHEGKKYSPDFNRIKFSHVKSLTARLKSGLEASYDQETGISTVKFTKEYAEKELEVLEEMFRIIYATDFDLDSFDIDLLLNTINLIKESDFFIRLGKLNK